MLPTLDEFLKQKFPFNSYIKHPDFESLYLRKNKIVVRYDGKSWWCDNVITIASILARKPGMGAFQTLVKDLVSKEKTIYVENVHTPWFQEKLLEQGFIQVNIELGFNYLYNQEGHLNAIE